jgi:hypothetical protein
VNGSNFVCCHAVFVSFRNGFVFPENDAPVAALTIPVVARLKNGKGPDCHVSALTAFAIHWCRIKPTNLHYYMGAVIASSAFTSPFPKHAQPPHNNEMQPSPVNRYARIRSVR